MGFRRLRGRLDGLESGAHQTMWDSRQLLAALKDLVEDVHDGVNIQLVRQGSGSFLDFFRGKYNTLNFQVRIAIEEPPNKETEDA